MAIVLLALVLFGAYRVWIRDSFFGAKKQSLKMLFFCLTMGMASIFLLVEVIFQRKSRATARR